MPIKLMIKDDGSLCIQTQCSRPHNGWFRVWNISISLAFVFTDSVMQGKLHQEHNCFKHRAWNGAENFTEICEVCCKNAVSKHSTLLFQ